MTAVLRPEPSTGYPVLVVDDHELFSTALTAAFRAHGFDARHVSAAGLRDFLARRAHGSTGLALLDLEADFGPADAFRPWASGSRLVRSLCELGWKVLAVSSSRDTLEVAAAIACGAIGSLSKSTSFDDLVDTVVTASEDRAVMSDAEHRAWLHRHRRARERELALSRLLDRLSIREREVLEMLTEGHRAAAIAEGSVVSITTVRSQIRAILTKLEVNSQLEAIALLRSLTLG
jgi:DNA-binding NarL/FixJ family response regulator